MKREYRRHLPDQIPEGAPIFITWSLKGSIPVQVLETLRREHDRLKREPSRAGESKFDRKIREAKVLFLMTDKHLDSASSGPMHLKDEDAAKSVEDSIRFGVPDRYELFAWCIMANHVHVLLKPVMELCKIMQGIKGFTSRQINSIQSAQRRVFWQDESYDHWPRDEEEFFRIIAYIENNPVAVGLCERANQWRWSSARLRGRWPVGQAFQPDKHWRD